MNDSLLNRDSLRNSEADSEDEDDIQDFQKGGFNSLKLLDEEIPFKLRSYSTPDLQKIGKSEPNSTRHQICQEVLLQIKELSIDLELASQILDGIEDSIFAENSTMRILDLVLNVLYNDELQIRRRTQTPIPSLPNFSKRGLSKVNSQTETCKICLDEIQERTELPFCKHAFCKECLDMHFRQNVYNGNSDRMICPLEYCGADIGEEYLQQALENSIFQKMIRFRNIKLACKDPNIILCPSENCEKLVHRNGKKKILCECGQTICARCCRPYHSSSCKEKIDSDFRKAISNLKLQKCPECRAPIQKNEGCNHMTCHQCRYEFCWLCRGKYSPRHYSEWNLFGCPGMQYTEKQPFAYPWVYRILALLGILIFGLPIGILAVAVGAVLFIFFMPVFGYFQFCEDWSEFNYKHSKCMLAIIWIFLIVCCAVVLPISLLLFTLGLIAAIVLGIPYLLYLLYCYCRDR